MPDPDFRNHYLFHREVRNVESNVVIDSICLAVSGKELLGYQL